MTTVTEHYRSRNKRVHRVRVPESWAFGQITHDVQARTWSAEIRHRETGNLLRYAGVWGTKRAAVWEITSLLENPAYQETR